MLPVTLIDDHWKPGARLNGVKGAGGWGGGGGGLGCEEASADVPLYCN